MNNTFKKAIGILMATAVTAGCFGFGIGAGGAYAGAYLNGETQQVARVADTASYDYVLTATLENVSSNSVSGIFKAVRNSVVSINVRNTSVGRFNQVFESTGAGSGIIFQEDDSKIYIVTNYHVVAEATGATVSLDDAHQVKASYVGGDEQADLAIISVAKADLAAANFGSYVIASFGDSSKVEVGDAAIAIGNAMGEGKSATLGIISAVEKVINIEGSKYNALQTDAAINPGNSGGALVNSAGKVIGINSAKLSDLGVEGMGYAIPANAAKDVINTLMSNGSVGRPYLGIYNPTTIDDLYMQSYNFPRKGVYVSAVYAESTAALMGMQRGDLIYSFNGAPVLTAEELTSCIAKTKVGDTVKVEVMRGNTEVSLEGKMQAFPNTTNF